MKLSNSVKQRFCKDFSMPFQVVQEPMFSHYIKELDEHFATKSKLELLYSAITSLGGEDALFNTSNKIKSTIINAISKKEAYSRLSSDISSFESKSLVPQKNIYTMNNTGKTFISLDLKHANFNVFKMYDSDLVLGFDSYEDLIGSLTDLEYFKQSKYLRQVIFGNLLPKKQQKLQKWVINKLIDVLNKELNIELNDFISSSADEVVFVVDPSNIDKFKNLISKTIKNNTETASFADWVKVESYTLKSVENKKFFVKELSDGSVEFKCIPSYFFMQVYKQYTRQPIEKIDKTFYYDGLLATFDKTIFE